MIASKFGGPESYKNLVPQAIPINLGFYKRMEDFIGDNLSEIDKDGTTASKVDNSVTMIINLGYGASFSRDFTNLLLSISKKTFGREWNKIKKMPEGTRKERQSKNEEKTKLKDKEAYFNSVKGGEKLIEVNITPWIPTVLTAEVQMESLVPVAEEDTKKYFQETVHEGTKGHMIYAEDVKIDENGEIKIPEKSKTKKVKKKWSATFTFNQNNDL